MRRTTKRLGASIDRELKLMLLPRALRDQARLTGENVDQMRHLDIPAAMKKVQAATSRAAARYEAGPYSGRIVLFRAARQPRGIVEDPTNGWSAVARGTLEVITVPGHHGAMIREPRVGELAAQLKHVLQRVHTQEATLPGIDANASL